MSTSPARSSKIVQTSRTHYNATPIWCGVVVCSSTLAHLLQEVGDDPIPGHERIELGNRGLLALA